MARLATRAALAATISVVLALSASAQRPLDEIVARVGNDIILKSEFDKEKTTLRENLTQQGLQGAQLEQAFQTRSKDILRDLIDTSLLVQQAKDMGISGDLEVVKREEELRQEHNRTDAKNPINTIEDLEKAISQQMNLDEFKQSVKSKYLTNQVLSREVYGRVQQNITTEELRTYYDAHQKDFDRPAGIHIREIMVNTDGMGPAETAAQRKKIDDAVAALKKGDEFADVASKYSESDTAQNGGDLGFFQTGQLQKELEDVIAKLDKGQISEVIKTSFGFMVIKLEERHSGGVLPFESAQNEVYGAMFNEKAVPKVREYLNKLREDGFVWVKEGYVDTGAVKTPN